MQIHYKCSSKSIVHIQNLGRTQFRSELQTLISRLKPRNTVLLKGSKNHELFERPISVYSDNTHFLTANKLQALKNVQLTNSATKLSGETVE